MKKESSIQKSIINYLSSIAEEHNIFFFSIPNESLMTSAMLTIKTFISKQRGDKYKQLPGWVTRLIATLTIHFKKMGMVPGVPDLCICWDGKTIFIEVKKPGEKPSVNQERIHEAIRRAGHSVWTVFKKEDVETILIQLGVEL